MSYLSTNPVTRTTLTKKRYAESSLKEQKEKIEKYITDRYRSRGHTHIICQAESAILNALLKDIREAADYQTICQHIVRVHRKLLVFDMKLSQGDASVLPLREQKKTEVKLSPQEIEDAHKRVDQRIKKENKDCTPAEVQKLNEAELTNACRAKAPITYKPPYSKTKTKELNDERLEYKKNTRRLHPRAFGKYTPLSEICSNLLNKMAIDLHRETLNDRLSQKRHWCKFLDWLFPPKLSAKDIKNLQKVVPGVPSLLELDPTVPSLQFKLGKF